MNPRGSSRLNPGLVLLLMLAGVGILFYNPVDVFQWWQARRAFAVDTTGKTLLRLHQGQLKADDPASYHVVMFCELGRLIRTVGQDSMQRLTNNVDDLVRITSSRGERRRVLESLGGKEFVMDADCDAIARAGLLGGPWVGEVWSPLPGDTSWTNPRLRKVLTAFKLPATDAHMKELRVAQQEHAPAPSPRAAAVLPAGLDAMVSSYRRMRQEQLNSPHPFLIQATIRCEEMRLLRLVGQDTTYVLISSVERELFSNPLYQDRRDAVVESLAPYPPLYPKNCDSLAALGQLGGPWPPPRQTPQPQ